MKLQGYFIAKRNNSDNISYQMISQMYLLSVWHSLLGI